MNKIVSCILLLCVIFTSYSQEVTDYDKKMAWWRKAKLGMFIHWGPYAIYGGVYRGQNQNRGGAEHAGSWDPAQQTKTIEEYMRKVSIPQVKELLSNYGDVAILWWDTPVRMTDEFAVEFQKLLDEHPQIITNDRLKRPNFPGDYKMPEAVSRLKDMGKWMSVNGEAIYETQRSVLCPSWGECMRKDMKNNSVLYLCVFDWPADEKLLLETAYKAKKATLLYNKQNMKLTKTATGYNNSCAIENSRRRSNRY